MVLNATTVESFNTSHPKTNMYKPKQGDALFGASFIFQVQF